MRYFTVLVGITLLLLGATSAFALPPTQLGFLSDDMTFQYCDYEEFKIDSGGFLAAGYDNNAPCGLADGVMIGVQAKFPPSNLPVTGPVLVFGDSTIDASYDAFTGDQAMLVTKTVPYDIHAPHFGWEALFNTYDSFYVYLADWGYLTATLPAADKFDAKSKGTNGPRAIFTNLTGARNVMQ
jgi:hypothetical protein